MTPKRIVIHCSANSNGALTTGEDIKRFHKAPVMPKELDPKKLSKKELAKYGRGWSDIGYHGVIETDGGFFQGRPDNRLGAHVEGHNDGSLGICLIGNDKFTRAQFESLRWWLDTKLAAYKIGVDQIFCHYEFNPIKPCPNMTIQRIKAWYVHDVQDAITPYILDPVILP